MKPAGSRRWVIAEGYIPGDSSDGDDPRFQSHETACILNVSDKEAKVAITVYFADREPVGPYRLTVPVVVQHTRLDSRQSDLALITTVAHAAPEQEE